MQKTKKRFHLSLGFRDGKPMADAPLAVAPILVLSKRTYGAVEYTGAFDVVSKRFRC